MPDSYSNSIPLQSQNESEDFDWDVTPLQARKRRLGAATETDPPPPKRVRLTALPLERMQLTKAHKVWLAALVHNLGNEATLRTYLYHPEPKAPPGQSTSSFRDYVQPHHDPQAYVSKWLKLHCMSSSQEHHFTRKHSRFSCII
ncbi:hypothetical protein GGTG_14104 [Gaeumannomyces tritici R3-111a-1]|uniref:Uncharacterized protein n=1 Tax=Gaeumannomyces tritici (strain R3-111a-1) TaxID=644352 RepID=J3PKP1_GAET3|nr:hypothetical protein GGTG_14104 [Gaeumannomyces tritici R3-111a-1]EJT68316.1 hypothetical protein GGTG_14104 [Gaeumannomyces tritici R3-111a-1]